MAINKTTQFSTNPDTIPTNTSTGTDQPLSEAMDDRSNKNITYLSVDSVSDLQSGDYSDRSFITLSGYYGEGTLGGGTIYLDELDTATADNGGSVFVDSAGNRWKRPDRGYVDVSEWGASEDLSDNTARYDAIISNVAEGSTIKWPDQGLFVGNFLSSKAFRLELGNSIHENFTDNDPIIFIQGSETSSTTTTGSLTYGDRSFDVNDATGIVAGSLIRVFDGKVRPSDSTPEINSEVLKVESVSSNTVTVEDMVRSEQDSGTVTVMLIDPLISPSVNGGVFKPSATHTSRVVSIWYARGVNVSNVSSDGFYTRTVDVRYSYDTNVENIQCIKPRATGSGEGYGVGFVFCRESVIKDITGDGCRHALDFSSCYTAYSSLIKAINNPAISSIDLSHNTFGGNMHIDGVVSYGNQSYSVNWSGQGVSTPSDFVARDVSIKNIHSVSHLDFTDTSIGVYLQTSLNNVDIDGITHECTGTGDPTTTTTQRCVRINGVSYGRGVVISNVRSEAVGNGVFYAGVAGLTGPGIVNTRDVHIGECEKAVWIRGQKHCTTGNVTSRVAGTTNYQNDDVSGAVNVTDTLWGLHATIN